MGGAAVVASNDSGRAAQYEGKTTLAVVLIAIVAASGGLLFGYDNGITGGVIGQEDFQSLFFPALLEPHPEGSEFCKFNDHLLQLFTSSLFLAGAVAAMIGMVTSKKYGRKATMTMGGVCFLIGTALVASAFHIAQLVIGRVVLGLGVGFATQATPLYLAEMAPYNLRGALNIMFQLAVTIGIFAAQAINLGTQHIQPWGWRLSLALGAIPALLLFVGSLMLPDTPNSLVERGHTEQGRRVLERIRGTTNVDVELDDIIEAVEVSRSIKNPYRTITRRRYWPMLTISILVPMFQQFTGINAIMFYSPQLFASLGGSASGALLNTVVIGAVNVGSTLVSIVSVDRLGRRALFFQGGAQMIICEIIVGVLIQQKTYNAAMAGNTSLEAATLAFICLYVAGFAWSWGPLGWLVPSEVQPLETRAAGTAINTCVNFLFTFIIGQCFLSMLCSMEYGVFFFFGGMVLLATIFVFLLVPETRNVPIEELEEVRIGKHWFWSKVIKGTDRGDGAVHAAKVGGVGKTMEV